MSAWSYQHWVIGLRLDYSRRLKSGRAIDGKESSFWPTPNAWDGEHLEPEPSQLGRDMINLVQIAPYFVPGLKTRLNGNKLRDFGPPSTLRLNPRAVEWMMGFPDGWTSFTPLATPLSLWSQRMRSALSRIGC
jgi:hypothetical protein